MTADRLAAVGESCDHRRDQGPGLIRLPTSPSRGRAAVAEQGRTAPVEPRPSPRLTTCSALPRPWSTPCGPGTGEGSGGSSWGLAASVLAGLEVAVASSPATSPSVGSSRTTSCLGVAVEVRAVLRAAPAGLSHSWRGTVVDDQVEGSSEERRHLVPGDGTTRLVATGGRPAGDAGGSRLV